MVKNFEDLQQVSKENVDLTLKAMGALSKGTQAAPRTTPAPISRPTALARWFMNSADVHAHPVARLLRPEVDSGRRP